MTKLTQAFAEQSEHCTALGSPFMGQLMALCAERWPREGAVAQRMLLWPGHVGPAAASLPLRIAGGLHALVLSGQDLGLAAVYPPHVPSDTALWDEVARALEDHQDFLLAWIKNAPQTNEVRRSAALIPAAHLVAARFEVPWQLSELGASGGLNLNFDAFHLETPHQAFGPDGDVCLSPRWTGPCPTPAQFEVSERRGVDLNPLLSDDPDDALRLQAYLWPDQTERMARTRAALALPAPQVDQDDAVDWLARRLDAPFDGGRMIYSTVAWQYFSKAAQQRGVAILAAAGSRATEETPLAWISMETDGGSRGAALVLHLWPGALRLELARVDFHGRWLEWTGPISLT
ncbi:MAG: DUF2332 family protein [Marinovum sp.]|nr:DUF2332 family protein [Marinovum sp.]